MHPADFLSLVVEVAIAIAGFSGIVVVLGRRQAGDWTPVDRLRLQGLLNASFAPIAISGLALVLLSSEVSPDSTWRISSSIYAFVFAIFFSIGMRRATQLPPEEINRRQMRVVGSCGAAFALLLVLNAVSIAAFWPLGIALGFQIGLALFNFVGLLSRSISGDAA